MTLSTSLFRSLLLVLLFVSPAIRAEEPVSFVKQIAPVLVDKCVGCHQGDMKEGEYSLGTYAELLQGGGRGKAIEVGKPEESIFSKMLHGTEEPAMPFEDDKLDDAIIALVDRWIKEGAKFDGPNKDVPLDELVETKPREINRDSQTPAPISALAFRPDGQAIAVAGYYQITLWEPTTGKLLARIPTKSERIQDLAFSADGTKLFHAGGTPSTLGEVVVWDWSVGKEIRSLVELKDVIFALALRPGAPELAAGGADRTFRVWNVDTGEQLHAVENHADWILDLAYTPDGKRILSASRDRSVKVWDQTTTEPLVSFSKHTEAVFAVSVNADGTLAASVGSEKKLHLWKIDATADIVRSIDAHSEPASALLFSRKEPLLFSGGNDRRVVAWNPADGSKVREYTGHGDFVFSIALSPDESLLATGDWAGELRIWKAATGELVKAFNTTPALTVAQDQNP